MHDYLTRRDYLKAAGLTLAACTVSLPATAAAAQAKPTMPNMIVIFTDDLGYGDLSSFGHPTIRTPNLDRMAAEGMKLTQFYTASAVCTPSRAGLMTGRLPIRNGMCSDKRRVLFPDSAGGLPKTEITIATALKKHGYATSCVGKWHLGHLPEFMPTNHGFDEYFGIPYSNDMKPSPLVKNLETIEEPVDQHTLTKRYTAQAERFITANKDKPFFLYFAHSFPHVPLFASKDFEGKSPRGLYGDVVEELDWSVGRILETLKKLNIDKNTVVFFTSDNGPWLTCNIRGGSAGLLRGGKGSTWEGGMRVPTVAWWPGTIKPATINTDITSTVDIFPTCLDLAGAAMPTDRIYDGFSLKETLVSGTKAERELLFYYRGTKIYAVRKGPWKLHFITQAGYRDKPHKQDPPMLFHLDHDPSEKYNIAAKHPDVVEEIIADVEKHKATVKPFPTQLEKRIPKNKKG